MKISKLSVREITDIIANKQTLLAMPNEGGFVIKINKYVPYLCIAVHNGGKLRPELKEKIIHNDYERWYEEDPHTADFISSMPITIVGLDSRFEYDLNRSRGECIYQEAWGKTVWKKKLSSNDISLSLQKHDNYYTVLNALVSKLENLFGKCVLYDIHSYNHRRWEREVPLFNIGTELIDKNKFGLHIDKWKEELSKVEIAEVKNTILENDVFKGRGYTLEYINTNFKNTLVLATDIKKVYCDELTADVYPKLIKRLAQTLKSAILSHAHHFSKSLDNWHHVGSPKLLDKNINDTLLKIDKMLFSLLHNFELLSAVNPINTKTEKKRFFRNKRAELPQFKYMPVKINPYVLKQKLLSAPIQEIQDISIRGLYEAVVNANLDKIDLIGTLNTKKFLYNSLRYFGRPSKSDIMNANYILHLPDIPGEPKNEPVLDSSEAMAIFKSALNKYGIKAKVEFSNKVISHVMVLNSKKCILIQPETKFKQKELKSLIEHEIGIHMATTMNSHLQKLKVFNLGMPVNTLTQEGLAVLAEYLSGNFTLHRLKKLALRVIAVDMMCSGADFIDCFEFLTEEQGIEHNEAFNITARVFRGGGFTKDFLYLSGFIKVYKLWNDNYDLVPLLIGKTSLEFYNTIEELMGREMVSKPKFIANSFICPCPENNNSIYDYILSGLKY